MSRHQARAFLAAMLEGVEAVVSQLGGIRMPEDAEHAAVMFGVILHRAMETTNAAISTERWQGAQASSVTNERKARLRGGVSLITNATDA